jgi:predicted nucleic acid-binding protein
MGRPAKGKQGPTTAPTALVLDNSIVMAWSFEDEASPFADAVLDALEFTRALVPTLWPLEVANALLVGERRKRISQADSLRWIQILATLPIAIDDETNLHVWTATMSLAREQNLSAYDAAYLELATLDAKLRAAAQAVGVPLYGTD